MTKSELLKKLYEADSAERAALEKMNDARLAWEAMQKLSLNDLDRRESVEVTMQELSHKTQMDYFHAASIYSHGDTVADYEKATKCAEQALFHADNNLDAKQRQQITRIYATSRSKCQAPEDNKPKDDDQRRRDEEMKKTMRLTPEKTDDKQDEKAKKKKEEEAQKLKCVKCGMVGHSITTCLRPR